MPEAFPLDWPEGWPRARYREDGRGRFATGQGRYRGAVTLGKAAETLYAAYDAAKNAQR